MCLLHQLNAISWKAETVTFRFIENPDSASKDANTLSLDFIPEIQTHAQKRWVMWDSRKLRCSVTEIIAQSLVLLPKDSVDSSWQFCDPRQTVLSIWTGQQMKTLRVNRELRILWRKKKLNLFLKNHSNLDHIFNKQLASVVYIIGLAPKDVPWWSMSDENPRWGNPRTDIGSVILDWYGWGYCTQMLSANFLLTLQIITTQTMNTKPFVYTDFLSHGAKELKNNLTLISRVPPKYCQKYFSSTDFVIKSTDIKKQLWVLRKGSLWK